jgi:hypothetical protein
MPSTGDLVRCCSDFHEDVGKICDKDRDTDAVVLISVHLLNVVDDRLFMYVLQGLTEALKEQKKRDSVVFAVNQIVGHSTRTPNV